MRNSIGKTIAKRMDLPNTIVVKNAGGLVK